MKDRSLLGVQVLLVFVVNYFFWPERAEPRLRASLAERAVSYGMPSATCDGNDVWAVYEAGVTGSVTIETCGSLGTNGDTKIAAYPLAPCSQIGNTAVACSDDNCITPGSLLSSIDFNVRAEDEAL